MYSLITTYPHWNIELSREQYYTSPWNGITFSLEPCKDHQESMNFALH